MSSKWSAREIAAREAAVAAFREARARGLSISDAAAAVEARMREMLPVYPVPITPSATPPPGQRRVDPDV